MSTENKCLLSSDRDQESLASAAAGVILRECELFKILGNGALSSGKMIPAARGKISAKRVIQHGLVLLSDLNKQTYHTGFLSGGLPDLYT